MLRPARCNRQEAWGEAANKGGMAARSLLQVTALPLMHLSLLFNPNPFTTTPAPMAKGAKRSQIFFFCASSLVAQRLEQMAAVKCAEYIGTGFSFLLWHRSEHV